MISENNVIMDILLNDPWVSGVSIAVIAGLILYYVFGVGKGKIGKKNTNSFNQNSPHITAGGSVIAGRDIVIGEKQKTIIKEKVSVLDNHVQVTPEEIVEYLNGLPPLQRKSGSRSYQGIKVSWLVKFKNAVPQKNGKLFLITHYPYNFMWINVTCTVSKRSYPKLKIIEKNHSIQLEGVVESVDPISMTINLKNCRLDF